MGCSRSRAAPQVVGDPAATCGRRFARPSRRLDVHHELVARLEIVVLDAAAALERLAFVAELQISGRHVCHTLVRPLDACDRLVNDDAHIVLRLQPWPVEGLAGCRHHVDVEAVALAAEAVRLNRASCTVRLHTDARMQHQPVARLKSKLLHGVGRLQQPPGTGQLDCIPRQARLLRSSNLQHGHCVLGP